MELHPYKLKEESVKNMHYSFNPEEIRTEIEKLGHSVTNIWNIKQYRAKLPLSTFSVELKLAPNNKGIFNVEYTYTTVQYKIRTIKKQKGNCSMCKLSKINNYCHLNPRCVKCAGDHLTNQCHQKESSSNVRCVLCGGNHPAKYKGCTVYKQLQKKTYPPPHLKHYTPAAQIKHNLYTQPGITYAQITKQNFYAPTNVEQEPHINQLYHQQRDVLEDLHIGRI
jgi:hypothetical protein